MTEPDNNSSQLKEGEIGSQQGQNANKKPYEAPQILSVEDLEVAAAACDPPTGGFGKTQPIPCTTLGS